MRNSYILYRSALIKFYIGTPPPLPDKCRMPKVPGPCPGYFPRYYYDAETESCKLFVYGGCRGNDNNFKSKDACMEECGEGT